MLRLKLEPQCPRMPRAARWDCSQTSQGSTSLFRAAPPPSQWVLSVLVIPLSRHFCGGLGGKIQPQMEKMGCLLQKEGVSPP